VTRVKIVQRPPEFDAIQYTGANEDNVAAFVGFLFRPSSDGTLPAVYDPLALYFRELEAGSWVVMITGMLSVLTDDEFHAQYSVVKEA
jgi:hypothetical protein